MTPILLHGQSSVSLQPKIHSLLTYSGVVFPDGTVEKFTVRDQFGKEVQQWPKHRTVWNSFRSHLREKAQIEFQKSDPGHLYPWQTSEEEVAAIEF
jgi:hypothetical protein